MSKLLVNLSKSLSIIESLQGVDLYGLRILAGVESYNRGTVNITTPELKRVINWSHSHSIWKSRITLLQSKGLLKVVKFGRVASPHQLMVTPKGKYILEEFERLINDTREIELKVKVYQKGRRKNAGRPEAKTLCQECLNGFTHSELTIINNSFYCGSCASELTQEGEN
jgi:hypothetical protein